jgi:Tfp pilus assembly protein PilF
LVHTYSVLGAAQDFSRVEAFTKAKAAADRALELDDSLAEAHSSSGFLHWLQWKFASAEPEFKRALDLNPNAEGVRADYAAFLTSMGRLAGAGTIASGPATGP